MAGMSDDPEIPVLVGKAVEAMGALMPPELAPLMPFSSYLSEFLVRHQQQRWLKWERTLTAGAEDAGCPIEALLASLEASPAQQELLARVLEASGRAIHPNKVLALGRVLSRGIQDDRVDEALMLADALAAIEAPHIQTLLRLAERREWLRDDLDLMLRDQRLVLPGLLATLSRTGLAETGSLKHLAPDMQSSQLINVETWKTHWWITQLGDECLKLLAAVGGVDPPRWRLVL